MPNQTKTIVKGLAAAALAVIFFAGTSDFGQGKGGEGGGGGGRGGGSFSGGGHGGGGNRGFQSRPSGGGNYSRPGGRDNVSNKLPGGNNKPGKSGKPGGGSNNNHNNNNNNNNNGGCKKNCNNNYYNGWDRHDFGYAAGVVTGLAIGSIAYTLPTGCVTRTYGGVAYRYCGTTWYRPQVGGSTVSYVVVNQPY